MDICGDNSIQSFFFKVISDLIYKVSAKVGEFATQLEYRMIIILEAKRFCIWKVRGKKSRKNMSPIFSFYCVFYRPDERRHKIEKSL